MFKRKRTCRRYAPLEFKTIPRAPFAVNSGATAVSQKRPSSEKTTALEKMSPSSPSTGSTVGSKAIAGKRRRQGEETSFADFIWSDADWELLDSVVANRCNLSNFNFKEIEDYFNPLEEPILPLVPLEPLEFPLSESEHCRFLFPPGRNTGSSHGKGEQDEEEDEGRKKRKKTTKKRLCFEEKESNEEEEEEKEVIKQLFHNDYDFWEWWASSQIVAYQ